MPFFLTAGNEIHGEPFCLKTLKDFVANLKGLEGYARSYNGGQVGPIGVHGSDGFLYYILYRALPPGMDGGNGVIAMIVEEYGDAVCCLDGKTQAGDIGEDGIGVVGTAGGGNTTDIGGVGLAGKG